MEKIRLTGRSSRLSLLQMEKVKHKIETAFPGITAEMVAGSSLGDTLQSVPLQTVEGSDFFTQEISEKLRSGDADIAVHSLKDMSSDHFFGKNTFAVVDREDARDVAIFNKSVLEKIKRGDNIKIGTCSPRREEMATGFLQKALPQLNNHFKVTAAFIRGNVDTRLKKLDRGEYDGIILATAGLNRLLTSIPDVNTKGDSETVKSLLADKKLMLLPLIECVPAPCQGAIVAEAIPSNVKAVEVLKKINNELIFTDCCAEKKEAVKHGKGCIQKFGVTTIETKNGKYLYAAGKDTEGTEFIKWHPLPVAGIYGSNIFSSNDVMKDFFDYEWKRDELIIEKPVVFVANYKAVQGPLAIPHDPGKKTSIVLNGKIILASGTKTWIELAKKGYWVTASADALGFEFLLPAIHMPLFNIRAEDISILTHESGADRWRKKGYHAVCNYKLISKRNKNIQQFIAEAGSIFWSSYSQYEFYGEYAKPGAAHLCPGGETAALLKEAGVEPVVFPTIKAFELWRKFSIRSHSVA